MKGVPIKFRAKGLWGEGCEYGLLTKKAIRSSGEIMYALATGNCTAAETVPIKEDTIAQLCGYDANGNEVYEGDRLVEITNAIITTAHLYPNANFKNYNIRRK